MNPALKVVQLYKDEYSLIEKALQSNRDAQRLLFEKYAPKMKSVCRYYVKSNEDAEEVMLNGFLKVFKNLKSYRNEGSFEGWIRKIMCRECLSFLRSQKDLFFPSEEPEKFVQDVQIESDLDTEQIQMILDEMPTGYKGVFLLYAIEGYKHKEIAERLDISEGSSKSQLSKARKWLQQRLKSNTIKNGTHKI